MNTDKINAPSIILNKDGSFGKTEEYKRSPHPDFSTSKELVDMDFSGVRNNSILNIREIWILGNRVAHMPEEEIAAYPDRWEDLYRDVFALKNVEQVTQKTN